MAIPDINAADQLLPPEQPAPTLVEDLGPAVGAGLAKPYEQMSPQEKQEYINSLSDKTVIGQGLDMAWQQLPFVPQLVEQAKGAVGGIGQLLEANKSPQQKFLEAHPEKPDLVNPMPAPVAPTPVGVPPPSGSVGGGAGFSARIPGQAPGISLKGLNSALEQGQELTDDATQQKINTANQYASDMGAVVGMQQAQLQAQSRDLATIQAQQQQAETDAKAAITNAQEELKYFNIDGGLPQVKKLQGDIAAYNDYKNVVAKIPDISSARNTVDAFEHMDPSQRAAVPAYQQAYDLAKRRIAVGDDPKQLEAKAAIAQQALEEGQKEQPERVFENLGSIRAAIAIALGAFGAGLTGGPNVALKLIDDAVRRDVEKQRAARADKKERLGQAQGALPIIEKHFTDQRAQTEMLYAIAYRQTALEAEKMKTGADAQMLSAAAMEESAKHLENVAKIQVGAAVDASNAKANMINANASMFSAQSRAEADGAKLSNSAQDELAMLGAVKGELKSLEDAYTKLSNNGGIGSRVASYLADTFLPQKLEDALGTDNTKFERMADAATQFINHALTGSRGGGSNQDFKVMRPSIGHLYSDPATSRETRGKLAHYADLRAQDRLALARGQIPQDVFDNMAWQRGAEAGLITPTEPRPEK